MSYTTSTITVRPNTNVPFWDYPDEVKAHIETNYVIPGLRLSVNKTFSDDQTTRTYTTTWKDRASYTTFLNDPIMLSCRTEIEAYNHSNDIFSFRENY